MSKYADLFNALSAPFDQGETRTRAQSGRQFSYARTRVYMNRFDTVLGPENWWDSYTPGEDSIICRLTIRLPDGSTLTKSDAGGRAGMTDEGDDEKSGFSDAFKRAAVKFGVGRYLYEDGMYTLTYNPIEQWEPSIADDADAPAWSVTLGPAPEANGAIPRRSLPPNGKKNGGGWGSAAGPEENPRPTGKPVIGRPPTTGRALFEWATKEEKVRQVGLVKFLSTWGKGHGYPGRILDWDDEMTRQGYAEAVKRIQAVGDPDERGDAFEGPDE